MAWYSWMLFLVSVALISPLAFVAAYFGRKLHSAAHTTQGRLAGLVGRFEEAITGAREIKSFAREPEVAASFDKLNGETLRTQLRREKMDTLHPFAVGQTAGIGVAVMIVVSTIMLDHGLITFATLTAFMVCVGLSYSPLQEAAQSIGRLIQLFAVLDRFDDLLGLPVETSGSKRLMPGAVKGAIRFDHVWFSHEDKAFSLEDFNLDIRPGHKLAIVGPSGAGKSTLLDLVARFLTPQQGAIRIDGEDAANFALADLRRKIGFVSQEPVLFESSLMDNLRFAMPDASEAEVHEACRAAYVDEFAQRLPMGYDTHLQTGGTNLSVGQRQRIAIARVLLKNPHILLLDEPTSALDSESERLVRQALDVVSQGRTTLIVAHRMSTVRDCDRIIVMDTGRIVEDGTHDELFARHGLYYRLCREQVFDEPALALKPAS